MNKVDKKKSKDWLGFVLKILFGVSIVFSGFYMFSASTDFTWLGIMLITGTLVMAYELRKNQNQEYQDYQEDHDYENEKKRRFYRNIVGVYLIMLLAGISLFFLTSASDKSGSFLFFLLTSAIFILMSTMAYLHLEWEKHKNKVSR